MKMALGVGLIVLAFAFAWYMWKRALSAMASGLLLLSLIACAQTRPLVQPSADSAVVVVDKPTEMFFLIFQQRLMGHRVIPDHEYLLCLYGEDRRPRYVKVESIRATQIDSASAIRVWPQPCPMSPDYLGVWHPHFPGDYHSTGVVQDACWFSPLDTRTFLADPLSIIDVVTCGGGRLITRAKKVT